MTQKIQESPAESKDVRVTATSIIWGIAVGMLAICIPLSSATKSGSILPLATMTAAAIGTVAVWRSDEKKSTKNSLLPQNVELLEQRIANLETIITRDDFDLRMKIKQVESRDRKSDN